MAATESPQPNSSDRKKKAQPLPPWARFYFYGMHGLLDEIVFTALFDFFLEPAGNRKLQGCTTIVSFFIYGSCSFCVEQIYTYSQRNGYSLAFRLPLYVVAVYMWELSWGVVLTQLDLCSWDYSHYPLNLMGLITLVYAPGAGVGRTGTYIALDMVFDLQSRRHDVNVNKLVTQLREERCLMVQSEAQYSFLHEVILEAHTSRATRVPVTECDVIFPGTIHVDSENARIDKEFQFSPKPKHTMASMPENVDKNRNMDALPDDEHIVYLGAHVRGRNQYINGVNLSSFRHRRGFILTQLPLSDTVVDFWRLVDGCNVNTVVSIGSADEERSVKDYCHFWPRQVHEVLTTGPYTITLNSAVSAGDHLASNKMTLKAKTEDKGRQVEIFHYNSWAGQVTGDTSSLLHLVDTIKAILSEDSTSPVIVQCIDGAAKSGLFCALYDVISRVTSDNEVDVYLAARQVQRVRPQAVATQTQYRFLYKCVQDYIRHQDVYQNADVTQSRY